MITLTAHGRARLCWVVCRRGPKVPASKHRALPCHGVCLTASPFLLSFPAPCLALVLSVNLISANLFLPFELLLLNYCRVRDAPQPDVRLALSVRYKLIRDLKGEPAPPSIAVKEDASFENKALL